MKKKKIEDYTPAELRQLADDLEYQEMLNSIPKPLDNINLDDIISSTEQVLEYIATNNHHEDNIHDCYEQILTIIYGKDIFKWINNKL